MTDDEYGDELYMIDSTGADLVADWPALFGNDPCLRNRELASDYEMSAFVYAFLFSWYRDCE